MMTTGQQRGQGRTGAGVRVRTVLAIVISASLATLGQAAPAAADTAQATAQAVDLTLGDGTVVATSVVSAFNDGTSGDDISTTAEPVTVLGSQTFIDAGVLTAAATARNDGTSAACSGVVGDGGSIAIGSDNNCAVDVGLPGQIRINLSAAVFIQADAVIASCTASSDGTTTTSVDLVGARVTTALTTLTTLPAGPAPDTTVDVIGLATLGLHRTASPGGAGNIEATALNVDLLAGLLGVDLGLVSCGQNVVTVPTPAVPAVALPVFGAALAGTGIWIGRRWRRAATVTGT